MSKPIIADHIVTGSLLYDIDRLANLGNALSSVSMVMEAMQQIEGMQGCQSCDYLPQALTSGYVMGGLIAAVNELGSSVSSISERWRSLVTGEQP